MDGMAILKKDKQFMTLFLSKKSMRPKEWIAKLAYALAVRTACIMDYNSTRLTDEL
jgi:hypothetical protein